MVFQLKVRNKTVKYKFDHRKLEKIKSMFSKVKCEAKNEIYLNGWSNQNLEKKDNYINCDENINFKFKNYIVKTVKEPDPIVSEI